jgi:hypothetical protein
MSTNLNVNTSMNDFHAVEIGNGLENFLDDGDRVVLCEPSAFADSFKEFSSGSQFGDNVKVLAALEPFFESDNMGMMKSLEEIHFVVDHVFMTFDILFRNDLDGYRAIWAYCLLDNSVTRVVSLATIVDTFQPLNT